jgi:uncharacterized protein
MPLPFEPLPFEPEQMNVLGGPLQACCHDPLTGFYRDAHCHVGPDDHGVHAVCCVVNETFLTYSRAQGNDLSTPQPGFPGLRPGNKWCLCAARWLEAWQDGMAPPVVLEATSEAALAIVPLNVLQENALEPTA